MINFFLAIVPSDLHLDAILVLTIHAVSVTPTRVVFHIYYLVDELLSRYVIRMTRWIQLNVTHKEAHLLTLILLQHMNCLIGLRIIHKRSLNLLQEVVTQCLRKTYPDIRHAIAHKRQKVELEVLLKYLLLLHHLALAHLNEQLTFLVSARLVVAGLYYACNSLLLLRQVVELLDYVGHCGASVLAHASHGVGAELEKHWEELGVDGLVLEELGVVAQVLCQNCLESPLLLAGFLE